MKTIINSTILFRCNQAGVWVGVVTAIDEKNNKIQIKNAYRLWNWQAKDGISLSEVATNGVTGGKICKPVDFVWLNNNDVYEAISVNDEAFKTIVKHANSI